MTKKELKQKIIEYVNSQSAVQDEWWTTDRKLACLYLSEFAKELGIKIDDSDFSNLNVKE